MDSRRTPCLCELCSHGSKQAKRKPSAMYTHQPAPKSNKKASLKQVTALAKDAVRMLAKGRIPKIK